MLSTLLIATALGNVLMMETETEVEPKELLSSSSQITAAAKNAVLGAHLIKELSKWEEAQNAKKKPLKRLKVEENSNKLSWRSPEFADWKITWSIEGEGAKVWDVHRCIVAGGPRRSHFFAGATSAVGLGSHTSAATELGMLLPKACLEHFEEVLDFMYGEPLLKTSPTGAVALFKTADVLQCPMLQNAVIDLMDAMREESGGVEALLKAACSMNLFDLAGEIVDALSPSQICSMDVDLLELENLSPLTCSLSGCQSGSKPGAEAVSSFGFVSCSASS